MRIDKYLQTIARHFVTDGPTIVSPMRLMYALDKRIADRRILADLVYDRIVRDFKNEHDDVNLLELCTHWRSNGYVVFSFMGIISCTNKAARINSIPQRDAINELERQQRILKIEHWTFVHLYKVVIRLCHDFELQQCRYADSYSKNRFLTPINNISTYTSSILNIVHINPYLGVYGGEIVCKRLQIKRYDIQARNIIMFNKMTCVFSPNKTAVLPYFEPLLPMIVIWTILEYCNNVNNARQSKKTQSKKSRARRASARKSTLPVVLCGKPSTPLWLPIDLEAHPWLFSSIPG